LRRELIFAPCLLAGGCLLLVDPPASAGEDESEADGTGTSVGAGPPVVMSFRADQDVFTEYESITFTVVVEDPDGASDISVGELTGSSASTVYGNFLRGNDGEWEYETSWSSIAAVASLSVGPLELWARFEDHDGNVGQRKLELEICGDSFDDGRYQECGAAGCVDTNEDSDYCGDCYSYCAVDYACSFGECTATYGEAALAASRPIPAPTDAIRLSPLVDEVPPLGGARLEPASVRAFDL